MSDVVVGVDESEGAKEALRWAVREATRRGWSVTAVMAWGLLDQHRAIGGDAFDPGYGEEDAASALATIVTEAVGTEAAGTVERRAVCDLPAQALVQAAADAQLLVVGARGLGGFRGLLLGSVSRHLLHHATTPVAIVRAGGSGDGAGRVVVGVDGSPTARRALAWALEEARLRGAPLSVVSAWHQPEAAAFPYATVALDPAIFEQAATTVLDEALAGCDLTGVDVTRVVSPGTPAGVILAAASDADLVVVGSRGRGGLTGVLLGSVADQVTHHAACPVVVIPAGG